jgi:hypothetical protein
VWEKAKQPLFITNDNKAIYEGDEDYWRVTEDFNYYHVTNPSYHRWASEKYFSTQEKAEQYIQDNKPCLSYNDVEKVCILIYGREPYEQLINFNKLKELIKSKL